LLVTQRIRQVHCIAHQLAVDEVNVALLQLLNRKALLHQVYELKLFFVNFLLFGLELADCRLQFIIGNGRVYKAFDFGPFLE
jgi:hypothetical protein